MGVTIHTPLGETLPKLAKWLRRDEAVAGLGRALGRKNRLMHEYRQAQLVAHTAQGANWQSRRAVAEQFFAQT